MFGTTLILSFAAFAAFSRSLTAIALTAVVALLVLSWWLYLFGSVSPEVRVPKEPSGSAEPVAEKFVLILYRYGTIQGWEAPIKWPKSLPTIVAATGCYDRRRVSAAIKGNQLPIGGQVLPFRPGHGLVSTGAMVVGNSYGLDLRPAACLEGPDSRWFDFAAVQTFTFCDGLQGVLANVVDGSSPDSFLDALEAVFGETAALLLVTLPLISAEIDATAYRAYMQKKLPSWTVSPAPRLQSSLPASAWVAFDPTKVGIEAGSVGGYVSESGEGVGVSCVVTLAA